MTCSRYFSFFSCFSTTATTGPGTAVGSWRLRGSMLQEKLVVMLSMLELMLRVGLAGMSWWVEEHTGEEVMKWLDLLTMAELSITRSGVENMAPGLAETGVISVACQ